MSKNTEEMSFWDHLEDLRWAVFRSSIVIIGLTILGLLWMPHIYDSFILGPAKSDFFLYNYMCKIGSGIAFFPDFCDESFDVKIININLTSQFMRHMTTSLWLAVLLSFPYFIYEVWRFIKPGLYKQEKRNIRWVLSFGTLMFFIGCTVAYCLVFPITFRFLATYELSTTIENQISLDSYMDNFMMLILVMGIVFELPLLAWLLSKMGFLDRSFFSRYRRHTIVILMILAAIITPSGDPFTLMVVFLPLYLLFELSQLLVRKKAIIIEDKSN